MIKQLFGSLVAVSALLGAASLAEARTLNVVASFGVLADVVKNVGGDNVNVVSLVPTGGDPHEFEPTPADARNLSGADLVFVSGFGFEGWIDRLVGASGYKGEPVVVSDGIAARQMEEDGETVTDPHVWNSAANVGIWIANIEKALAEADPEDSAAFRANAERYGKEVADLDAYAKKAVAAVPEDRRKVLTSHDALGYFGREYGVTFLSPVGISTEAEASAGDVAQLIDQIKAEQVKVYFFESSNDSRLVRQIADATGAEPGGELYVEALSPADGPAPTYLTMFKHNVDLLVAGMTK
ncbi:metal ABC transporter solute-binding protein, Zn/Mn family [Pleomorphomonas carboxyditropha]|uniref:ABC transporter substrate-binding protein n=1 Tax=Pleomorphomonas carboxyditropha TaxID=2023338 RepID=A0A2G9WTN5_9HYPH|nr:zinc ABC transporter substrate-binding protein [Pleomorphomonas carboxyditropha]PIO98067.1 ABC transporter substrate-binding protein [Pleomorphomonas carboxyditropha]